MLRVGLVTMALMLTAMLSVETNAAPQPFPDCGLARYDAGLPARIVIALREMSGKLGDLPPGEIDVTDIAYAEGILRAVPDCLDPNVRFLADNDEVAMELRGLAHNVCQDLIGSPELRPVGATAQVRDVRTDQPIASCGHHPILGALVGIGLNVVVVKMPRHDLNSMNLIRLGRSLARNLYLELFDYFEPSPGLQEFDALGIFSPRMIVSWRRLTLKDGTKVGFLSRRELPEADRGRYQEKAVFKVVREIFGGDPEPGWLTNCHGTTFLGGALWLQDANTIVDRAFEEISPNSVKIGDLVLWKNTNGMIIHSATIVAVGETYDKILLYQDAGGLSEHIVSLQDHWAGAAAGSEGAEEWFFARIRSSWPN